MANSKIERTVGKSPLLPLGVGDILFYQFNQNNSGGRYKSDADVAENVLIAARNAEEANERALKIGIYFDGCSTGDDCDCCGDRWYSVSTWSEKATTEPLVYGMKPDAYLEERSFGSQMVIVHHSDGSRETFAIVDVI